MPRKIAVVVTARASYARIKSALLAIHQHPDLELQLVVGASALHPEFGDAVRWIEQDGLPVARRLDSLIDGDIPLSAACTISSSIALLAEAFDSLKPDAVLTVADRYETIATAITAATLGIPLVHVQGGEVSGNLDNRIRHAVSKLADYHFVATDQARTNLLRMGESKNRIVATGCPSIDLARHVVENPHLANEWDEDRTALHWKHLPDTKYLVVLYHPETDMWMSSSAQALHILSALRRVGRPVLWFLPNADPGGFGIQKLAREAIDAGLLPDSACVSGVSPEYFLHLVNGSGCVVGNSSVGIRECSYLGVPAVNVGSRQSGRERAGNVVDVEATVLDIASAIDDQLSAGRYSRSLLYGSGVAGQRIAQHLAG